MRAIVPGITAIAVILAILLPIRSTFAGSATWKASAATGDWNTATNWMPNTVPNGPSDTATFTTSNRTAVSTSGPTELNGIVFDAGASAFTVSAANPAEIAYIAFSGAGIANNSGITQNFTGRFYFGNSATAGSQNIFTLTGVGEYSGILSDEVNFNGTANAGDSTFILNGADVVGREASTPPSMAFSGSSTAAGAIITVNGRVADGGVGGEVRFWETSSAGNATLIANGEAGSYYGGQIQFVGKARGGTARVEVYGSGSLHVEGHDATRDLAVGSIEGDGQIYLGGYGVGSGPGKNLIVGSNNLSTTFSGVISGGYGGSLTKVGTGTLTLTGTNTSDYQGTTTIKRGRLLVNNTTGSATGYTAVQVNAGKLGGNGIIAGRVTVGDGVSRAAFLTPGPNATVVGRLLIQGGLTFNSDATYKIQLNSATAQADKVVANGVTINTGAQFRLEDLGNGTLAPGAVFTIISNTRSAPITGTFSNLADGSTFTSNGNTFKVDYQGGDGNDLTLTVQ